LVALPQVGEGNDDRGGAGPHVGLQAQPPRREIDRHLQPRRRGAVLVQPPCQLQQEGDARVQRGGDGRLAARGGCTHAAARTFSVVPSTATTSTVLPSGRSGPLTSHWPSPTRTLPRPLTMDSISS